MLIIWEVTLLKKQYNNQLTFEVPVPITFHIVICRLFATEVT